MRVLPSWVCVSLCCFSAIARAADAMPRNPETDIHQIITSITTDGKAYADLTELVHFGHRLAGSPGNEKAVEWAKNKLESLHLDRISLQPVSFPKWQRGDIEVATLLVAGTHPHSLMLTTLGGSVSTSPGGIRAPVIEVKSLQEVEALGVKVKGKIVFFNGPMDPTLPPFAAYSAATSQRTRGPAKAAQYGAVAVLVRSLTTNLNEVPHTGITIYEQGIPPIPAAALSTQSANLLSTTLQQVPTAEVFLNLNPKQEGTAISYNVIGEWRGTTLPHEIVVVGGHLDSWDLGVGAHDDGAGVVQSIEVMRKLSHLTGRLKRTVRVVLFAAEEFGGYGGEVYARIAKKHMNREIHIAALESDEGGFAPVGFAVDASDAMFAKARSWEKYLAIAGASLLRRDEAGVDITPMRELMGTSTFGLNPDATHYFDYHHNRMDRLEAVIPTDLHKAASAMATLVYLLAEM